MLKKILSIYNESNLIHIFTILECTEKAWLYTKGFNNPNDFIWANEQKELNAVISLFIGIGEKYAPFDMTFIENGAYGEKYGLFDMTFIENGAYNENWAEIHMIPKESVQAHLDLKGKLIFPIHNGTFELALHSWTEPFERVLEEAAKKKVRVLHPRMGEVIELLKFKETSKWWLK